MSATVQKRLRKSRKKRMDEAFAEAIRGLAKDIPIIMHGSVGEGLKLHGSNVSNEENKNDDSDRAATVSHDTQHLVAALTAQYIQRLVDGALDTRDMLLFSDRKHYITTHQLLPPPSLASLNQTRSPTIDSLAKSDSRKRSAVEISNWDEPLPKPKIIRVRPEVAVMARDDQSQQSNDNDDQWVGAAGLDLWENSRTRAAYVQHRGVSAQQFIFPLCHDSYIYGRIREVQATTKNVTEPLLHDATIWDVVRTEGQLQRHEIAQTRRQIRRKTKRSRTSDKQKLDNDEAYDDDPDESDSEEENAPTWPGLDLLLPANRITGNQYF
jgi:hypothetical protein